MVFPPPLLCAHSETMHRFRQSLGVRASAMMALSDLPREVLSRSLGWLSMVDLAQVRGERCSRWKKDSHSARGVRARELPLPSTRKATLDNTVPSLRRVPRVLLSRTRYEISRECAAVNNTHFRRSFLNDGDGRVRRILLYTGDSREEGAKSLVKKERRLASTISRLLSQPSPTPPSTSSVLYIMSDEHTSLSRNTLFICTYDTIHLHVYLVLCICVLCKLLFKYQTTPARPFADTAKKMSARTTYIGVLSES